MWPAQVAEIKTHCISIQATKFPIAKKWCLYIRLLTIKDTSGMNEDSPAFGQHLSI